MRCNWGLIFADLVRPRVAPEKPETFTGLAWSPSWRALEGAHYVEEVYS
jgi:hypothetical protein